VREKEDAKQRLKTTLPCLGGTVEHCKVIEGHAVALYNGIESKEDIEIK
jgi:hypothetical protein